MGVIRGSLVIVVSVLLLISFIAMNSLFILSSSLKYNNVQEGLTPVIQDITGQESQLPSDLFGDLNVTKATEQEFQLMQVYCNTSNYTNYAFIFSGYNVNISCEDINMGQEAVIDNAIRGVVEDIYYKDYNCNFWNCFSKESVPFFLVSQKAESYWSGKFYLALLASLILIALLFLLVEHKQNGFIITGALLILSVLPLLKLGSLLYAIAGNFSVLLEIFLKNVKLVYWISIVIGIILIGLGIAFKFWHPDFLKGKLSKNEVKDIVKKEMSEKEAKPAKTKSKK